MRLAPCAALLLLLGVPVAALPPDTTIAFSENPTAEHNQGHVTLGQGIAYAGGDRLLISTNDQLTTATTWGGNGCTIQNYNAPLHGDPAYYNSITYLPVTYGTGANANSHIARYSPHQAPYCQVGYSWIDLGPGRIESITYHRGHFYTLWHEGDSTDLYLHKYNLEFEPLHSWFLASYGTTSYTGPQGISFYGDMLIMPRLATSTNDYGVEFWQFAPSGTPELVGSTSNPIWFNSRLARYEIASEGLDVVDDLGDGAATPHVWFAGRDASSGQGSGSTGFATYDLLVTPGTYNWTTPPVTPTGSAQVLVDQDNGEPEGIAVDATHVYVTYPTRIEKWTHDGTFVTEHDITGDAPDVRLGGAAMHGGSLYVGATNEPQIPRTSTILQYDPGNLTLVNSRTTEGGDGHAGGVGIYNNKLYLIKNKDLSEEFYVQQYDPGTLDFLGETSLGYYHELDPQGIDFVNRGSTVYLYAAHDVPGDAYTHPGVYLWKSLNNGASWEFHGVADYPSWTNPGDADRLEVASQDLEYGCLNDAPHVWMVGRAEDGTGFGSWTRFGVSDPDQYHSCINPPTATLTISTDTHALDGTATTTGEWAFPLSVPGADVLSTTYLKVVNSGTASGTVRVDLDDWIGPGTIPAAGIVYHHGAGATPADVAAWGFTDAGLDGSADLPAPEGATTWIQYQVNLPSVVPDGTYAAPLTITDVSRKREPGHRPDDGHRACDAPAQGRGPPGCRTGQRGTRNKPLAGPARRSRLHCIVAPPAPTRVAVSITNLKETRP